MKELSYEEALSQWEGFGWDTPTTPSQNEGRMYAERKEQEMMLAKHDAYLESVADTEGMLDQRDTIVLRRSQAHTINLAF